MRKPYLDNLRWATVWLVVLYHIIYMFNGLVTELVVGPFHEGQLQDAVQYLLYPWFMVLLFVVSGVSARYALQKQSGKQFLRARTRRLLVPSTLGLLVFHWIGGYVNMQVAGGGLPAEVPLPVRWLILSISGTGVLWFIQMLWVFSLLLLPLRRLEKGRLSALCEKCGLPVLLLLAVPLWLSAQILNTPVIPVYRFGIYGLAFFLGYFLFSRDAVTEHLQKAWLPLTVCAALLGIGYTIRYWGENYTVSPVVNAPFSIFYGWIAVLAAFALAKRFADFSTPATRWLTRNSFGLYVFHYLPLSAAALWLCKGLPPFPGYLLAGLAAFGGGYGLNFLISRIPVLRWCVLGIKKEEKRHVS